MTRPDLHVPSEKGVVRVLLFSASLRADSLNTRLASLAYAVMQRAGARVELAAMQDFDGPSYNFDVEAHDGFPAGPLELHRRLEACDGFVIATPEYNASMPGHLKNAIDWVSRIRPQPFNARHALLLSASPSMAGGNRGLWSLRIPLEHLGARVFPDMFSLAQAHKAFTETGELADRLLAERFEQNLRAFLDLVEAAKHYPCIKKAWVEFLGEPGNVGRVEAA
ncbi:MAG TPA: NAD(P)H-dependent oxidoreductase [Gemmatimonadales bacterium]|jgi:NAD(P)H-dependent FMN reductase|nr:NAD(P)H-dependent oxidoreductase [Gemmatimonadales bacterium]